MHDRVSYRSQTILAKNRTLSTDSWETGLNNNMLVLGPSGSGKTRHVLKPNLLQMGSSFVVLDAKGVLHGEMGPTLASYGYDVQRLDLAMRGVSDVGYDPLAFIRRYDDGRPYQVDVLSVAQTMCPAGGTNEPFWDHAAAMQLAALIAYTIEQLPAREQTVTSVFKLVNGMTDGTTDNLFEMLEETDPTSVALSMRRKCDTARGADKMYASIVGVMMDHMMPLMHESAIDIYTNPRRVDFARMGHEHVALFVTIDDLDRSMDSLVSIFVNQAIRALMGEADRCEGGMLPLPVRLFLDDFANLYLPGFDDVLAVARSREVWVTLLCQTLTQLEARYGEYRALSIVGNCDTQLVLACQDYVTASHFAQLANRPASELLATPLDRSWLFVRGRGAERVSRYDVRDHPLMAGGGAAVSPRPVDDAYDVPFDYDDEIPF